MTEEADKEISAMSAVANALQPLDPDAIRRVLTWATQRYQVKGVSSSATQASGAATVLDAQSFNEIHELFDAANPSTATDRALVAGYWFQVVQKQEDLDSQELNKELKHMGHQSANITRDLDSLINRTPRWVIQTRKQGNTKQARKRYKLTREGIRAVERMLAGTYTEGSDAG